MKAILLTILLSFICFPLFSLTLSQEGGTLRLSNEPYAVDFSLYGVHLEYGDLSIGGMDDAGLFGSLDHFHHRRVLSPFFSSCRSTTHLYGGSVSFGSVSAFLYGGRRVGGGVYGTRGGWEYCAFLASGAVDKRRQVDPLLRRDATTLYLLSSYRGSYLEFSPSFSVTEYGLFSSFCSAKLNLHNMFISFSSGRLQSFLRDGDDYRTSFSLGVAMDSVSTSFRLSYGRLPIYSYEYRSYEAEWKTQLDIAGWRLSDQVTKVFKDGKEKRTETVSAGNERWIFSYGTERGFSFSVKLGSTAITVNPDSFSLEIEFSEKTVPIEWKLKLSSESAFDMKITISF